MSELQPPPESLRVDTAPDAVRVRVETMPGVGVLAKFVGLAAASMFLLASPFVALSNTPEEPPNPDHALLAPPWHLYAHPCELAPLSQMSPDMLHHCIDFTPFTASAAQVNRRAVAYEVGITTAQEARARAEADGLESWRNQHDRLVKQHRERLEDYVQRHRAYENASLYRATVFVFSLLGLLGLLALAHRFVRSLRPIHLTITDHEVRWNNRVLRRTDIVQCNRDGNGLVMRLADGTTLRTGPTGHDAAALDWIAGAIGTTAASAAERAEEYALSAEVRSRHAAMAGRVRA